MRALDQNGDAIWLMLATLMAAGVSEVLEVLRGAISMEVLRWL